MSFLASKAILMVGAMAVLIAASDSPPKMASSATLQEDEMFWDRFLRRDIELSSSLPPIEPCPTPPQKSPVALPPIEPCPTPPQQKPTALPPIEPCPTPTSKPPPPSGEGEDDGDCDVDVKLKCSSKDGRRCDKIKPPNPLCSDNGDIVSVSFGYTGNTCNEDGNSQGSNTLCSDCEEIDMDSTVTVLCKNAKSGKDLDVEPAVVQPTGVFTVTDPEGDSLPDKIDCIFINEDEIKLQQVIIDVSGDATLRLTDEFGAFTLLACGTESDAISCLEILNYEIDIENIGETDIDITEVDFTFNGEKSSLIDDLKISNLEPGESTTLRERVPVDVCTSMELVSKVQVKADPPEGNKCKDSDDVSFSVTPLPPSPKEPTTPVSKPVSPPISPPKSSPVSPPKSTPVSPPKQVPVSPPKATPVSPPVPRPVATPPVTPPVTIPVPRPVPRPVSPPITTPVSPPMTAPASPPSSNGPCIIMIDAQCVITGNNPAAGQACDAPVVGSDFVDFMFSVNIFVPMSAGNSVTLTSLQAQTNFAGMIDLTEEIINQTIAPGGSIVVPLTGTIDPSMRRMYMLTFEIEGTRNPNGVLCTGSDTLSFSAGNMPVAPSPGTAPTPGSPASAPQGATVPTSPATSPAGGTPTEGGSIGVAPASPSSTSKGSSSSGGKGSSSGSMSSSSGSMTSSSSGSMTSTSSQMLKRQ